MLKFADTDWLFLKSFSKPCKKTSKRNNSNQNSLLLC
jgi:hypothetical protein